MTSKAWARRVRAENRRLHSGASTAPETARRLAHLESLRRLAYEEKRREENRARPIPTSGPGRRRAKARRNLIHCQATELLRRVDRVTAASSTYAVPRKTIGELRALLADALPNTDQTDTFTDLERRWEKRAYVVIDPNVRVHGNRTFAGFEDCTRPVAEGEAVRVIEAEDGIEAEATVYEVDRERGLLYLDVDWAGFRDVDPELLPALRAQLDFLAKMARLARDQGVTRAEAAVIARIAAGMHGVGLPISEPIEPLNTAIDVVSALVAALDESGGHDD